MSALPAGAGSHRGSGRRPGPAGVPAATLDLHSSCPMLLRIGCGLQLGLTEDGASPRAFPGPSGRHAVRPGHGLRGKWRASGLQKLLFFLSVFPLHPTRFSDLPMSLLHLQRSVCVVLPSEHTEIAAFSPSCRLLLSKLCFPIWEQMSVRRVGLACGEGGLTPGSACSVPGRGGVQKQRPADVPPSRSRLLAAPADLHGPLSCRDALVLDQHDEPPCPEKREP